MPAPLQVGCHVKARVGPLVEHTKPDGTKAKRRQKSFMTGRIVAAKGPSMFSVLFENGLTKDMRSNTLVFGADPQFIPPATAVTLQIPTILPPPRSITIPGPANVPPPRLIAIPGAAAAGRSLVVPIPAPDTTTPTDFPAPSLVNNRNAPEPPELRHMPALLHHRDDDDDDASDASSIMPGLMVPVANWENVNDAEDDLPVAAGFDLLRAAGETLQANDLAPDDDNEEDEYENDIVEEDGDEVLILENADEHAIKRQLCEAEKKRLIVAGHAWTVGQITWTAVANSVPTDPFPKYPVCGIRGFNFDVFQILKRELKSKQQHSSRHTNSRPYLDLLIHFWPGDWKTHWRKLKGAFDRENLQRIRTAGKKAKRLKSPSQNEFWRFIGLIMAGGVNGQGGAGLWESREQQIHRGIREFSEPPDAGRYMSLTRFEEIRRFFPEAFADETRSDPAEEDNYDPWYPIAALAEDLSLNRHRTICTSNIKTMDESMSGWKPRKNKLGGLPNISFILRKPCPLGTEFKDTCDGETSIMLYLEIQRGRVEMPIRYPENRLHGATAACTLRQVLNTMKCGQKETDEGIAVSRDTFYGDSWFASVKAATLVKQAGHEFVGPVKTSHKNFPKTQLETLMKEWPGGMSFVLEGVTPPSAPGEPGCQLLAVGYKYNSRKVLSFVCTKDAGPTTNGIAYQAKWTDEYGNVRARPVERPEVISRYFQYSDVVDSHNHARQALLGLEKKWATQNCWFRLDCTIIGITLTDSWKAFKIGAPTHIKSEKEISVVDFTERVVWDCLNNKFDDSNQGDDDDNQPLFNDLSPMTDNLKRAPHQEEDESSAAPAKKKKPRAINMDEDPHAAGLGDMDQAPAAGSVKTSFSPLTVDSAGHSKWKSPVLPGTTRAKRLACRLCKRLTTMKCIQCDHSYCDDGAGSGSNLRFCWTIHKDHAHHAIV